MQRENEVNKVKGYRTMINLTQEEIAKRLGISERSYQNKEQGITKFTVEELKAIKGLLVEKGVNITLDDLA